MTTKRISFTANIKQGALSQQLGIPEEKNIPVSLLQKIKRTPVGKTMKNPTESGKASIKVTPLLKKRANMAITLKKFKR